MTRNTNAKPKAASFGEELIESMREVIAHQRGEIELEQVWPESVDTKAKRKPVRKSPPDN